MSHLADVRRESVQPLYVLWMVLLIVGFTVLQFAILFAIYFFAYGMPKLTDFIKVEVPVYAHSTWWHGRVVYPVMVNGAAGQSGSLTSFDPETGDLLAHPVTIPIPKTGLIAEGDTLWSVSPTTIVRVLDDQVTELTPKHSLKKPCPPFLYEGQPAVIDWVTQESTVLRTFDGEDWIDRGRVEIPTTLGRSSDASGLLVASLENEATAAAHPGRFSALDIRVLVHGGQYHLFVSDGVDVAYRVGIEFIQASALVPDNVPDVTDLEHWEDVCQMKVAAGALKKSDWSAGLVAGEPVVFAAASTSSTPFGNSTLTVFERTAGKWAQTSQMVMPALMDLLAFSDGERTYVAGQPPVPSLRFYKFVNHELQPTGTLLKSPAQGSQLAIEWIGRCMQWIYWPLLVVFAWAVTWLMSRYTTASYQFGAQTVELASYTRRVVARLIDHALYMIPAYFIVVASGFSSRESVEANMDRFFDLGADSMLVRYMLMMFGLLLVGLCLLVLNSILQGWWGLTLGKWICGIRTKRATLRPCGVLRALLRELLIIVDTLFGTTAIPATMSMTLTNGRQRLGDLAADTIVIRNRPVKRGSESVVA